VYVGLPTVGDEFDCEDPVASVESVKAASDVYAPYAGTITAVNEELDSDPSLVNSAAEGDGWFFRMTAPTEGDIATLLDADAYKALCEEEG
jgi:glycine cleavage system H protein